MFNDNCCVMFMLIMLVICKYLLGYMKCPWPLPYQLKSNIESTSSGCRKSRERKGHLCLQCSWLEAEFILYFIYWHWQWWVFTLRGLFKKQQYGHSDTFKKQSIMNLWGIVVKEGRNLSHDLTVCIRALFLSWCVTLP